MAGNVRLDLQVGLDLAFLQNQLSTIGSRLGGQGITLAVGFNTQSISRGLSELQQRIGRRTFNVKIESTTLEVLTAKVKNFQDRLNQLQQEKTTIDIGVSGVASITKKEARSIRTALYRSIVEEGGKIQVPATIRPRVTREDVNNFTTAVRSALAGISVEVTATPVPPKRAATGTSGASAAPTTAATTTPVAVTGAVAVSRRDAANIRRDLTLAILGGSKKIIVPASVSSSISRYEAATIKKDLTLAVLGGSKKIFAPISIKPSISNGEVAQFQDAIKARLAGISVSVKADLVAGSVRGGAKSQAEIDADVKKGLQAISEIGAARMQGPANAGVTEAARRTSLRAAIEDMTVAQLKQVAGQLEVGGVSRLRKADLIEKIVADASVEMIKRYLDPQAVMRNPNRQPIQQVLDTFARGVLHMLGMDPATLREQARQRRLPPSINWPAQAPPPAPFAGPSSTGRLLTGASAPTMLPGFMPAGLLPSMTRRTATSQGVDAIIDNIVGSIGDGGRGGELVDTKRIYAALQKNINEILRRTFAVVEVDVRETSATLQSALRSFSYIAQALRDAESRARTARIDAAVDSLMQRIEMTIRMAQARLRIVPAQVSNLGAPAQRMLQAQRVAGLLPSTAQSRSIFEEREAQARFESRGLYSVSTRAERMARREAQARARSMMREATLGPHFTEPDRGGALVLARGPSAGPSTRLRGAEFNTALEASRASMRNFMGESAPFIGGLRGIASEFGVATKQVLLYGTAYKGLAFITSLPGQIINAAKGQQQFTNALKVATQETRTFGKEMLFIDTVQRTFGLNLETTRTGFNRLFSSMAPTGFDSGAIEKLFMGISAASASLQLTPDRVDRVIYAFGQMASKGQIMSEELKGQLGDALPGALALFAKAAGMSIKDFNKAMEDGQFVGRRFQEVFAKVSEELINRFSTGAQAASRSIVGLTNKVQGEFTRTLEALAPFANTAIQAVVGPLPAMLRELGLAAQVSSGEIGRLQLQLQQAEQELKGLKATPGIDPKVIQGAAQSVAAYKIRIEELNEAANDPAIQRRAKDIQAFTSEVSKAGTFVMNLAGAIGRILGGVVNALGGNLMTVISTIISFSLAIQGARLAALLLMGALALVRGADIAIGVLNAARAMGSFGAAMRATGTNAVTLAGIMRLLGIQMSAAQVQAIGLRKVLFALGATTFVGIVVGGISLIATALASMGNQAERAAQQTKDAMLRVSDAVRSGQVDMVKMEVATAKQQANEAGKLIQEVEKLNEDFGQGRGGSGRRVLDVTRIPAITKARLEQQGINIPASGFVSKGSVLDSLRERQSSQQSIANAASLRVQLAEQNRKALGIAVPGALPPAGAEPPSEKEKKAAEKAKKAAEKAAEDARRMADEKRKYEGDLMRMSAAQAMELDNIAFENWKTLQDQKFDYMEAGQNEWMKSEIKLQRDLQNIEIQRIEAIRKARQETQKAEVEANAKAYVAQEAMPFKGGAAKFGDTGRTFNASGWVHGHFQNMDRDALVRDTTEVVMKLLERGVPTELGSGRKFQQGMNRSQVEGIVKQGIAAHKKYASGVSAIDVFVPQGTEVPMPLGSVGNLGGNAGVTGTLPGGTQLMHLAQGSKSSAVGNAARQRKELVKDQQAQLSAIEAINQKELEGVRTKLANEDAQRRVNIAIKEYVASIAPVEQQKLENSLLQERNRLMGSGIYGEALDTQLKISEVEMRRTLGTRIANQAITENQKLITANDAAVKAGTKTTQQANSENEVYAANIAVNTLKINELNEATKNYIPTLQEKLRLTQQSAEAELMSSIQRATPLGGMGLSAGFIGDAASRYEEAIGRGSSEQEAKRFAELQNQLTLLETRNNAIKSSILGIGDAFGTAMTTGIASVVDGTASAQEVFAEFLKSIGQSLLQAAQQMIATYIAIGIARIFAGLGSSAQSFQAPKDFGGGMANSFTGNFGSGPGGMGTFVGGAAPTPSFTGGIVPFGKFATGGVVTGPTLGLVGEGRYNEAIVPLPDGRSIPVQMRSQPGSRDLLSSSSPTTALAPILNMNFQTTTINGTEYVSREQLEQAMMETRKAAASEGASRGASLAIDRLQQSPNTRRRVGIR